jgi:hypothetical protein
MRVPVILFAALLACGCARHTSTSPPAGAPPSPAVSGSAMAAQSSQKLIVTPGTNLVGKVIRVNPAARFVVLNFPIGHLPVIDQRLALYRKGLKVGEVKVTGPQLDENVVADVIAGEFQVGDEARDN